MPCSVDCVFGIVGAVIATVQLVVAIAYKSCSGTSYKVNIALNVISYLIAVIALGIAVHQFNRAQQATARLARQGG